MNFRQKWMMLECNYVLWNILDTYTLKKYLLFFWKSNLTKLLYFIWQLHLVPFTEFILYLLICNIILLFFRFMYIWTLPYSLFCFNICIFSSLLITFLSELLTSTSRSMLNHSIVKLGIFVLFLILVGPLLVIPH